MSGVYISHPFCNQKCTFCNFASDVLPAAWEPRYVAELEAEIAAHKWEWTPDTVYFGGGTPNRLDPDALRRLLDLVPGGPWREVTLEAAPGNITPARARAWRTAGITRVSLGVQSFDAQELRHTGRKHTAEVVAREIEVLRDAGLGNINIDLIAGLAYQAADSWRRSLEHCARIAPPHVSVYILEVDEDSRLGREILVQGARYGAAHMPSGDEAADFYECAVDFLADIGIRRYEISNFARPGCESLHNLKYWRLEPYVGFGVDAHSFDGRMRTQNTDSVEDYLARSSRGEPLWIEQAERAANEHLWVGLRLMEGVPREPRLDRFIPLGLLEPVGANVRLTRRGVLVSNEVFAQLL
ncbi:MAG: radical SAM family heme chaperone HemW [Acidobacteria bacterium]|nr:radical SAM family heme chaperone HemW [Acidobacteriota bacterium]